MDSVQHRPGSARARRKSEGARASDDQDTHCPGVVSCDRGSGDEVSATYALASHRYRIRNVNLKLNQKISKREPQGELQRAALCAELGTTRS